MNISLRALWTNINNYVGTKIADGLTPLQKKVALFAIAYIAAVTAGYLFYRCFCHKAEPIEKSDQKGQSDRLKNPPKIDQDRVLDFEEVTETKNDVSAVKIAIKNVDLLRSNKLDLVITTEKDGVRLQKYLPTRFPLWKLRIKVKIEKEKELDQYIFKIMEH